MTWRWKPIPIWNYVHRKLWQRVLQHNITRQKTKQDIYTLAYNTDAIYNWHNGGHSQQHYWLFYLIFGHRQVYINPEITRWTTSYHCIIPWSTTHQTCYNVCLWRTFQSNPGDHNWCSARWIEAWGWFEKVTVIDADSCRMAVRRAAVSLLKGELVLRAPGSIGSLLMPRSSGCCGESGSLSQCILFYPDMLWEIYDWSFCPAACCCCMILVLCVSACLRKRVRFALDLAKVYKKKT